MPRKVFVAGEILTAADVNTNLMDQAVMVFDDSAARDSAIPTPAEGMVTYLSDVNQVQAYDGAAFKPVGNILQVVEGTTTTSTTSTSGSYADTNLSATITPTSDTSKIFISYSQPLGTSDSTVNIGISLRLVRDSTEIMAFTDAHFQESGTTAVGLRFIHSAVYLDSPATASAITYKTQFARYTGGGTARVNNGGPGKMMLLEVAG
jgi:hypothetical protein